MTVAPVRCPHCGAVLEMASAEHPLPAEVFRELQPMQSMALQLLVHRFGTDVPTRTIIETLYGGSTGPLDVLNAIRVRISELRHVVRPFGLAIRNERFPSSYRLERAA